MSTTTPRPPLYGNDAITKDAIAQGDASMAANGIDFAAGERSRGYTNGAVDTRDHYEATWGPLIQQLVDALADPHKMSLGASALTAAAQHGFTPSQP